MHADVQPLFDEETISYDAQRLVSAHNAKQFTA